MRRTAEATSDENKLPTTLGARPGPVEPADEHGVAAGACIMDLSHQQKEALQAVERWLQARDKQVFRLFGYAGTGKTTIAKELADKGRVLFGAFTGKAALVLQQKGCYGARTIHSLIYVPTEHDREQLDLLEQELEQVRLDPEREAEIPGLEEAIAEEKKRLRQPRFVVNTSSDVLDCNLVVIDEVSMVGTRMGQDLLSFGRPILVLGDPAQLPPVKDGGFFTKEDPDYLLTEIHRQAENSPVLRLATRIRKGEGLPENDEQVVPRGHLKLADVAAFDQVIVGTNKARQDLNRAIRRHLGHKSHLPEPGDRLVCLRNNHDRGLLNGGQWNVISSEVVDEDRILLTIKNETTSQFLPVWRHTFEDREHEIAPWDIPRNDKFDFGYALTCHKAQGSQWDRVLVIDESQVFGRDARRWLYTAVTRAVKSVTVVRR